MPSNHLNDLNAKIEVAQLQKASDRELEIQQAAKYVFAANYSLDIDLKQTKGFLTRTESIVGIPTVSDQNSLRNVVDETSHFSSEGVRDLKQLDTETYKIEHKEMQDQTSLDSLNEKNKALEKQLAVAADKQAVEDQNWWNPFYDIKKGLVKFAIWGAVIIGFIVLLPVLGSIFPVIEPFIGMFIAFIGKLFSGVFKAAPALASGAGLVAQETFSVADSTQKKLVDAIEQWKTMEQTKTGEGSWPQLKTVLSSTLNDEQKANINTIQGK